LHHISVRSGRPRAAGQQDGMGNKVAGQQVQLDAYARLYAHTFSGGCIGNDEHAGAPYVGVRQRLADRG
jgi:hypothetical protein